MVLISCHECSKEISDKATACPHCGVPANDRPVLCHDCKRSITSATSFGFEKFPLCRECDRKMRSEEKQRKNKAQAYSGPAKQTPEQDEALDESSEGRLAKKESSSPLAAGYKLLWTFWALLFWAVQINSGIFRESSFSSMGFWNLIPAVFVLWLWSSKGPRSDSILKFSLREYGYGLLFIIGLVLLGFLFEMFA